MEDDTSIIAAADIGRAIRATRRAKGMTQRDLASASGVGLRFLIEMERGKPTAQLGKALDVLRALGIELSARDEDQRSPGATHVAYTGPSR